MDFGLIEGFLMTKSKMKFDQFEVELIECFCTISVKNGKF